MNHVIFYRTSYLQNIPRCNWIYVLNSEKKKIESIDIWVWLTDFNVTEKLFSKFHLLNQAWNLILITVFIIMMQALKNVKIPCSP